MAALPKSFNLAEPIPSLPDGAMSQLITCRPISGVSFAESSIIELDLGNRGWCDPKSVSIRYKVAQTTGATAAVMAGVPVYTPFQRVSTLVGGASIDSISQYNQVAQVLVAGKYDVAAKYGLQSSFGYSNVGAVGAMNDLDGRFTAAGGALGVASYTVSAPLIGTLLTNCDKQLPLFAMPQIRFQFTLDSLANMFIVTGGASILPTAFSLVNFELCYTMTDLGASVEAMVYGMGRSLLLKSHGTSNSAVSVGIGSSGSLSYVFNQRFASVRSAFICPSASAVGSKWGEICDLTSNNGDYQILVGNQAFPQAPLSTVLNRSGILQETRRAFGNLYDSDNSMSINALEFARTINDATTGPPTYYEPGKFIVGVNLDKIQTGDHAMMSGASTYNTPISVNINVGTATTSAANLNLILDYDAILVLDPTARQLSVRS
jgi:hypothetical protein